MTTCPVCESCKDLGWCVRLREAEAERDAALAQVSELRETVDGLYNEMAGRLEKAEIGRDAARAQVAALREALERIAHHRFISYEAAEGPNYAGMYGIGVVDGHRCAAQIALAALDSAGD